LLFVVFVVVVVVVVVAKQALSPMSSVDPRRDHVKTAMKHAWNTYAQYGWGYDSMHSVSKSGYNWLYMNLTIVDAIDTLIVMEMTEEFEAARAVIEQSDFKPDNFDSLFDVTMRVIGGLLSAHSLSGDSMFLSKAEELERRLLPAYSTPSGIPYNDINPKTSETRPGPTNLAQAGTCLMELYYLTEHTGDPIFAEIATSVVESIVAMPHSVPALYPIFIDPTSGTPISDTISLDSCGDSFYEYLVKTWILMNGPYSTNEDAKLYRSMWDDSMDAAMEMLIKESTPSGYVYTTSVTDGEPNDIMGHLGCYAGAMFALGAVAYNDTTPSGNHRSSEHWRIGAELTRTCHATYDTTRTGIGPEQFRFVDGKDFVVESPGYYLRPEVVESYFYMWRFTHDEMYREWGWAAFEAINATCFAPAGFSDIDDVNGQPPKLLDNEDPFFLAETLKYLYLLFSEDELIPLEKYVFTTESHPLLIFG